MSAPKGRDALYDTAPCGLALLDADFRILDANRYFEDLAGATPGAPLSGRRFESLLSVAGRIYLQTRMQQELALTGRMEELALDLVRADGARTPAMLNLTQSFDEEGRPCEIQVAIWRAAAKRAYEAEVPKARLAAEQAARIKADFLANISHELRTPLNGVVGVAGMLEATTLAADQRTMVETIRQSGEALARLVGDLLDLANVKAGRLSLERRSFDLAEALSGVTHAARLKAEAKGLAFEAVLPQADGRRHIGDPVRLKQAIDALLTNAVKFTAAGKVGIEAVQDGGGGLLVTVSDTGIGFDDTTAARLFEDFGQGDNGATRDFEGAGVGLAIAKGLVDLMGGEIAVASRPGQGSRFSLRLPLALDEAVTTPSVPAAAEEGGGDDDRPLRILLVEDNPINQLVVKMILAAAQVDLVIADNGQVGVEAWRDGAFDLVLMDVQMPVMDGLAAIRAIRAVEAREPQRDRTSIIVLSANAMAHHRQEAETAGADAHLTKPISPEALIVGITEALRPAPPEAARSA